VSVARLTRAEAQAQTRQRLLDAAAVVFARRGFHGASLEEVADEAGYTKGAVYSNFASKENLFLAVLEARFRDRTEFYRRLGEQAAREPGQDLPGLLPGLDAPDEVWCLLETEFWLYALRNPSVRERMAALYRQYCAELSPLAAPYAAGDLDPEEVVAAVIALYYGLTLRLQGDPGAVRPDLVTRILRALERSTACGQHSDQTGRDRHAAGSNAGGHTRSGEA
jgi:AcrR family transcriptional regulator